jgi:dTDP-4-amino-4,6-dideoxygalactose transaminase
MINVTKTYLPDKEKYKLFVDRIFESGWLTNNGQFVQELERRLCEYLDVQHLLLVSNGTLALQVAYHALSLKKGEVITTPFSFVATTSSLVWEGYTPIFADIDANTLNIDPRNIKSLINNNTSAILPVHVFGNSCSIDSILEIADTSKLKIIFDAAHAFGIQYQGKSILQYGDASILSFHSTKIFHTIEGGAIIFKNKEEYLRAKLIINFGIPGYDQISTLGINCKMNEFQAAMGLCVLDEMPNILLTRKRIWDKYFFAFKNSNRISLQKLNPDSDQNFSYFAIIFQNENKALQIKDLLNKHNIWPRRYFYPSLESLPYIFQKNELPISSSIASRILCLPIFHDLENISQELIIETILLNI